MRVLHIAALVIYAFGIFAYGALLALWWGWIRAPRSEDTRVSVHTLLISGVLWSVSLVWFVINLLTVILQLAPGEPNGWPWWTCLWANFFLATSFPPLITHLMWAEARQHHADIRPVWRVLVGVGYLLAGALAVFCTLDFVGVFGVAGVFGERLAGTGIVFLFIGSALYSIAILVHYPGAKVTPRAAHSTRWHIGLFSGMAALFALIWALDPRTSTAAIVGGSLEILTKSLPIVFMFVGTYFESRFEFFDIFVKRGLALFVTLGLLVGAFAGVLPFLHRYDATWSAPWIYAVVFLPLAMALPWLHGRIGAMLDRRWLGRHYNTVGAVKHFLGGLRSATTEEQIVQQAETGLTGIFDAPAAVRLDGRSSDAAPDFISVQEVEIVSADGRTGRFLLGERRNETPYFSEDVTLLASLSDVFASVLDNLRLQLREQEQDRRARDLSLHATRSELKALRAQINPHFLFNALNSIAGLIHRDPIVADRTIEKLADVFRYALRGSEAEWTVLDDELEFVQAYLDVEQARFGTRLSAQVRLDDSARAARLPTMVIQTLVENAVKHGAATVRGHAIVTVTARRDGDRLLIAVEDNGAGFTASEDTPRASTTRTGGYGLANVRRRLDGYFGDAASLTIERDDAGGRTVASIAMPFLLHDVRPDRAAVGSELSR